jgi:hypothetical protein
MADVYLMQAVDDSDGEIYTWLSATADFAGADYDGPGDPTEVAVVELSRDPELLAAYLPLAGGTMTGDLNMGARVISAIQRATFSSTPAGTGLIALPHGSWVAWRNSGNTADRIGIGLISDVVSLGDFGGETHLQGTTIRLRNAFGVDRAVVSSSGLALTGDATVTGNVRATANEASLSLAPSVSFTDQLAGSGAGAVTHLLGAPASGSTGVYTVIIDGNAHFFGSYTVRVTNIAGTVTVVNEQENMRAGTEEASTTIAFDISSSQLRVSVTKASGASLEYHVFADPILYARPAVF